MTIEVLMPALSPTMETGTLAKWLKKEGDKVESGDVLAEIETDKASMEFEAVDEGVLGKILVPEGTENVQVNAPIALLLEEGEDTAVLNTPSLPPSPPAQPASPPLTVSAQAESDPPPPAPSVHMPPQTPPAPSVNTSEPAPDASWEPITVRDALRDAMAEEMRRDPSVFVMGEEVAEYQGAYKVTRGLLEEFGSKRVVDTPITEHGFAGLGVGGRFWGSAPMLLSS